MLPTTTPLYQLFDSFGVFTTAEIEQILTHFELKIYKKGVILVDIGQVNDKIYFIEKGILREFSYQDQDQTVTHWLMPENNFEYLVESFLGQKPATIALEVIENAKLWIVSKADIDKLYINFPQLNLIGRLMTEQYLQKYEVYITMLRLNPDEPLEWFNKYHPELANRVSVQHIASYLYLHRVTLSKIRSKRGKS